MSTDKLLQNNADIEETFSGIAVRKPVIDSDIDEKSIEKIDHQWLIATEIARRAINNSDVRNILIGYNTTPLSESMPADAINKIANSDSQMARLARRYDDELGVFLGHDEVPDKLLAPDIRSARVYTSLEDEKRSLSKVKQYYDAIAFERLLDRKKNEGIPPGITSPERALVAKRYRYARDIKMLGLMAELHDQPIDASNVENGLIKHELKSGVKIGVVPEDFDLLNSIIDTEKWESRRQIKDRVFAVTVDGKEYIMKERKTNRHTDTMEHGHIDTLTSEQEFEVAKKLSELGTVKQGDIQVKWERPLGYVEFPDGYQFCLFESDPWLKTTTNYSLLTQNISQEITKSIDRYQAEYDNVSQRAKEIYKNRKDLCDYFYSAEVESKPNLIESIKNIFRKKVERYDHPRPDELTVEEFADLKARHLQTEALDLLEQVALDNGYYNKDHTGHVINVHPGQYPIVEIIGFDFEYYISTPNHVRASRERWRADGDNTRTSVQIYGGDRPIMTAASYALLENTGYTLPLIR